MLKKDTFLQDFFNYLILSMDKSGKLGSDARAAEWALKRHFNGNGKRSPHQVYNLLKAARTASSSKKKQHKPQSKISNEDLAKLKDLTKRASEILKKYE